MSSNHKKHWGIQYLGKWCDDGDGGIELHFSKKGALNAIQTFWSGWSLTGYVPVKYPSRQKVHEEKEILTQAP